MYWTKIKNFCSEHWFGVTCVVLALAAFIAVATVCALVPPVLLAITAWAPFGGVQLFAFLSTLPMLGIIPVAAAAAFGAISAAAVLVAGGIFRTIVAGFNAITRSEQKAIEERNLAHVAQTGKDIKGNPVPENVVKIMNDLSKGKAVFQKAPSNLIDVEHHESPTNPRRRKEKNQRGHQDENYEAAPTGQSLNPQ